MTASSRLLCICFLLHPLCSLNQHMKIVIHSYICNTFMSLHLLSYSCLLLSLIHIRLLSPIHSILLLYVTSLTIYICNPICFLHLIKNVTTQTLTFVTPLIIYICNTDLLSYVILFFLFSFVTTLLFFIQSFITWCIHRLFLICNTHSLLPYVTYYIIEHIIDSDSHYHLSDSSRGMP